MNPLSDKEAVRAVFHAEEVVIFDASEGFAAFGGPVREAMRRHGYGGLLHLTHRGEGLEACKHPEVAIAALPPEEMVSCLALCRQRGIGVLIAVTPGFAESGLRGERRQEELLAEARAQGIRVFGPNCLGALNLWNGLTLCNLPQIPEGSMRKGAVSLFCHSGSMLGSLLGLGLARQMGFRLLAALGNEADLSLDALIAFALEDPETKVIGLVTEAIRHPARFLEVARQAARLGKALVVLPLGRSAAGEQAVHAHTAALATPEAIFEAVAREHGLVLVSGLAELLCVTAFLAEHPLPRGEGVAIWGTSGGGCALLADLAVDAGLTLAALKPEAPASLRALFGDALQNPLDLGKASGPGGYKPKGAIRRSLEALRAHPAVDLLLLGLGATTKLEEKCRELLMGLDGPGLPVILSTSLGALGDRAHRILEDGGVMLIESADLAVRTARAVLGYAAFQRRTAGHLRGRTTGDEVSQPERGACGSGLDLGPVTPLRREDPLGTLAACGLPCVPGGLARSEEEAVALARTLRFPLVMKVCSADVAHKTDVGLVQELQEADGVVALFRSLWSRAQGEKPSCQIDGILLQERLQGVEMFIGCTMDVGFGPLIAVGAGGIFAELWRDVQMALAPISYDDAARLVSSLRIAARLQGLRGLPAADIDALVRLIVEVSHLAVALIGQVACFDLNPVIVLPKGQGAWLVDAWLELPEPTSP